MDTNIHTQSTNTQVRAATLNSGRSEKRSNVEFVTRTDMQLPEKLEEAIKSQNNNAELIDRCYSNLQQHTKDVSFGPVAESKMDLKMSRK